MRKYLRSDSVEPRFATPDRPSRLDPFADKLAHMLRQEAAKSRKQKRKVNYWLRVFGFSVLEELIGKVDSGERGVTMAILK